MGSALDKDTAVEHYPEKRIFYQLYQKKMDGLKSADMKKELQAFGEKRKTTEFTDRLLPEERMRVPYYISFLPILIRCLEGIAGEYQNVVGLFF